MKKIIIAALVSGTAIAAAPAAAQNATGTVNVQGIVGARCSVIQAGGGAVDSFTGTIDLKRLDANDGTLRSELGSSSTSAPADGLKVNARVVCTTANPTVGVSATKLNTGGNVDAGAGYSNNIDYTASLKVKTAANTVADVQFATKTDTNMVKKALGSRIAGGTDNNVEVSVFGLTPDKGASSVLAEGTYKSVVTVSIEPTL